jgi:hypothetical protein
MINSPDINPERSDDPLLLAKLDAAIQPEKATEAQPVDTAKVNNVTPEIKDTTGETSSLVAVMMQRSRR